MIKKIALVLTLAITVVTTSSAIDTHTEKKLRTPKRNSFASLEADIGWLLKQIEKVEIQTAKENLPLQTKIEILNRTSTLIIFAQEVKKRVSKTSRLAFKKEQLLKATDPINISEIISQIEQIKSPCYPLEDRNYAQWVKIKSYHSGTLEDVVTHKKEIVSSIKKHGSYTQRGLWKQTYNSRDIPKLLKEIKQVNKAIKSYKVPSANSIILQLIELRKFLIEGI